MSNVRRAEQQSKKAEGRGGGIGEVEGDGDVRLLTEAVCAGTSNACTPATNIQFRGPNKSKCFVIQCDKRRMCLAL